MVLFTSYQLQKLRDLMNDFVKDESINTIIKYRQNIGQDYYNPKEQKVLGIYTDWSGVSALKTDLAIEEVEYVNNLQVGDIKFILDRSSVSGNISVKDVIVESGVSFNITRSKVDPLNLTLTCFARKMSDIV